jgi:hypothetical protein
VANQDATDAVVDLHGEQNVPVRITLTDRLTEISGTVPVSGLDAPSVIVFPDDAARWAFPSRHVRTAAVDERGAFQLRGLPPGVGYLAVAVEGLEDGEGEDPDLLARVRDRATRFDLADGERRVLDLPVIRR